MWRIHIRRAWLLLYTCIIHIHRTLRPFGLDWSQLAYKALMRSQTLRWLIHLDLITRGTTTNTQRWKVWLRGWDESAYHLAARCIRETPSLLFYRYGLKVKLDGVIYMHNIWNEEIYHRSHGSKFLSSQELEQLCGPSWHRKIMLVNSHWSENIGDDGEDREKRLREDYWSFMIKKGSEMRRYESPGDHQCARDILKLFLWFLFFDFQASDIYTIIRKLTVSVFSLFFLYCIFSVLFKAMCLGLL